MMSLLLKRGILFMDNHINLSFKRLEKNINNNYHSIISLCSNKDLLKAIMMLIQISLNIIISVSFVKLKGLYLT